MGCNKVEFKSRSKNIGFLEWQWLGNGKWEPKFSVWGCQSWVCIVWWLWVVLNLLLGFAISILEGVLIRFMVQQDSFVKSCGPKPMNFSSLPVHGMSDLRLKMVLGSTDGQLRMWDIRHSACVHVFDFDDVISETKANPSMALPSRNASNSVAHEGAITDLAITPDGRWILSSGNDDRLILWNIQKRVRELVQFPKAFNRSLRPRKLGMDDEGRLLFFPCGSAIQASPIKQDLEDTIFV